ncbi:hypothetical protein AVEN_45292-1 [Araneus ventricosus]|uniref:Uncharacterized protein n=1 Tax=Araneus ventricosus TaxID=182803 RepID=A0A4Y2UPC7_ARAVE|nr:hypothetical protein AVEN_45292-1 [Araneus ventricosus]
MSDTGISCAMNRSLSVQEICREAFGDDIICCSWNAFKTVKRTLLQKSTASCLELCHRDSLVCWNREIRRESTGYELRQNRAKSCYDVNGEWVAKFGT